eukprot:scaffold15633_cov107-Isochrysis_galbana.AAC.15
MARARPGSGSSTGEACGSEKRLAGSHDGERRNASAAAHSAAGMHPNDPSATATPHAAPLSPAPPAPPGRTPLPQCMTSPPSKRAQDQSEPAHTCTANRPTRPGTGRGSARPESEGESGGKPSAPCFRQPHASTRPWTQIASEWRSPAARPTTTTLDSAVTLVGDPEFAVQPAAKRPNSAAPVEQQRVCCPAGGRGERGGGRADEAGPPHVQHPRLAVPALAVVGTTKGEQSTVGRDYRRVRKAGRHPADRLGGQGLEAQRRGEHVGLVHAALAGCVVPRRVHLALIRSPERVAEAERHLSDPHAGRERRQRERRQQRVGWRHGQLAGLVCAAHVCVGLRPLCVVHRSSKTGENQNCTGK